MEGAIMIDENELATRTAAILKATEALQNEMLLAEVAALPSLSHRSEYSWTTDKDMRNSGAQTELSLQLSVNKAQVVSIGVDFFPVMRSTGSQCGEVGSQRTAATQTLDQWDEEREDPKMRRSPVGGPVAVAAASPICHSAAVQTDKHLVKSTSTDPIPLLVAGMNTHITGDIVECAGLNKAVERCLNLCSKGCEEIIHTRLNAIKQQIGQVIEPSIDRTARLMRRGIEERESLARELAMLKVDWLNATRDLDVTTQLHREVEAEAKEWHRKHDDVVEELHTTRAENLQLRQKVEVLEKVAERLERSVQAQETTTRRHSDAARSMSSSESEHEMIADVAGGKGRGHRQGRPPRYSPVASPAPSPHPSVPPVLAIASVVAKREHEEQVKLWQQLYRECEEVLDDA